MRGWPGILRSLVPGLLLLAACGSARVVEIGEEPARTVEVEVGQEFALAVETNASIGWEWELTGQPDPQVARFLGREYEADDPEAVGSGGKDLFRFLSEAPGKTTIGLTRMYRDEGPDRQVTVTVLVAEA